MSIAKKIEALDTKIAALQSERLELQNKLDSQITADKLPEGAKVTFTEGRGDEAKTVSGTVLGVVVNPKGGTIVTVLVGHGAATRIAKPFLQAIIGVLAA